ncbi:hypothetical protein [Planktosalinus lacus]|uniref:Lipoprotein n=1 Tax=Planktosalinus lacus TaxID=1526573 RepID=A0A8J2Y8F7_9FLAO|nr:hypothetical protein [Planktosalinus lacus]GGD92815.1 hypothetical protein GCM10011312_15780 [Planktosalinus lacus]
MKQFFLALILVLAVSSCDDGDIIVTTFDFEAIELDYCEVIEGYVFYKINNTNLETLSFKLTAQDSILYQEDTLIFTIDGTTNAVNYRTYQNEIPASYFCSSVPPITPEVDRDYVSNQGSATLRTQITDTTYSGVGIEQDTTFVFTTSIILNNIKLESQNEVIIRETIDLGLINN